MNLEKGQSMEEKLYKRLDKVSSDIRVMANSLIEGGLSERAVAGYLSTTEYINDLIGNNIGSPENQEKFIVEFQDAIRALVHGLIMGSNEERQMERLNIANGNGKLREEITRALRNANGTGKSGGYETTDRY